MGDDEKQVGEFYPVPGALSISAAGYQWPAVMPPGGPDSPPAVDPTTTTAREDAVAEVLERLDEFQRAVMFERLAQDGMTREKAAHVRRREWDREQAAKGKR